MSWEDRWSCWQGCPSAVVALTQTKARLAMDHKVWSSTSIGKVLIFTFEMGKIAELGQDFGPVGLYLQGFCLIRAQLAYFCKVFA